MTLFAPVERRPVTTSSLNGIASAERLVRRKQAATSAATSTQRTALVAPLRTPVIGECIEPETSRADIHLPVDRRHVGRRDLHCILQRSRTIAGTSAAACVKATINWYGKTVPA